MAFLEAHADKADTKLDAITIDITKAKTTVKVLWVILGVVGAIFLAIWSVIGTLVVMMAKHYLDW